MWLQRSMRMTKSFSVVQNNMAPNTFTFSPKASGMSEKQMAIPRGNRCKRYTLLMNEFLIGEKT